MVPFWGRQYWISSIIIGHYKHQIEFEKNILGIYNYMYFYTMKHYKFKYLLTANLFKVAEHSFQEPMPNSPLLLSYLCFGASFSQESKLTTEEFILAFWLRCLLLPWQRG